MLLEESHTSNASIEKQDDGDIRCPNCTWYFSSNTKPYILPCFHNLCDRCINTLIQKKNPKCPICSKIFTHEESNPFQVNFAFLNLVTKILTNKIIFCKKCFKIFYWFEHYTVCDQENFIEVDDIFNEIKKYCEQGIKIIKIFDKNYDRNFNILNKYKNDIMILLSKQLLKIRNKNLNKIKKEIEKIFKGDEKDNFKFNYKDIKISIINFLLICSEYTDYFDRKEIINVVKPYLSYINNNEFTNFKRLNEINKKNNFINQSARSFKISNIALLNNKNNILKSENNIIYENSGYMNKKNNKILNAKTPTKKKVYYENKATNIFKIEEEANNKSNFSPPITILKEKKFCSDNKENNQIENNNKNQNDYESEEVIDYNDDDYHDCETEANKTNNKYTFFNGKNNKYINIKKHFDINNNHSSKFRLIKNKKNENLIGIKNIFGKSSLQDSKCEKKLLVGLNEIKVISLNKKIDKKCNSPNSVDINKNKNNKVLINKNNIKTNNNKEISLFNDGQISQNNNITKNIKNKRINSFSSLNALFSSDMPKDPNLFIFKKDNNTKNINKNISHKNYINKSNNHCNTSLNNLKLKKDKHKLNIKLYIKNSGNAAYFNRNNNNSAKKNPFINTKDINNINNTFFESKNNKNVIINNPHNKSMNKIFNNFNNSKDIVNKVNKYVNFTKYIYNNININLNENISLLKKDILQDYNLLLDEVINNFSNNQRRFLFSFKNNTKFIILFDTEYNSFIPLDLSDILLGIPNFNSSIQFEFIESYDKYLLFITGGNDIIIKEKSKYSNDSFLIINIKINMDINSKNRINYKKKYSVEYKDKMPSGKSNHSILFNNNNLYIIGGFDNNKKASKECFYFSYHDKKWENLPKLNIPRANSSICIYNKYIIYIFRGRNNEGELNTIEYININDINNNCWRLINVIDYGYTWNNIYHSCAVVFEENKILIFGGEDENRIYKDSFLFDIKNNNIYRGMSLKIPAAFNNQGIFNNGKIYGFDFKNKNGDYEHKVHIFDLNKNSWSLINKGNNYTPIN